MLNHTNRCISVVSLCISIIICVMLFIVVDLYVLHDLKNKYKKDIYFENLAKQNLNISDRQEDSIKLKDTFIELLQVADIYNANETIENNNLKTTDNSNKMQSSNKWRIKIPKINIDAPINSGTSQEILANAVGHFKESKKWSGNVALAGHNRGYNCNFFQEIKKLEYGDKIIYQTQKGVREYKVIINKIIKQTDWSYIKNTKDNRITLITCVENMYEYRRCIQAVEIT